MSTGVVAALAAEARALGRPVRRASGQGAAVLRDGTLIVVSGIGCAAAERAARRLIAQGAVALVSWGVAGALDPKLERGAVCLPNEVIAPDGTRHPTSPRWRERLAQSAAACCTVAGGVLLTSLQSIDTAAAKASAHRATGAVAVDMESGAVAQVAALHGLPFLAVRAIVDGAGDQVPATVAAASQSGEVRMGQLLWGLARAPADWAPLLKLARRYRVATLSLRAIAGLGSLISPDRAAASGVRVA